MELNELQALLQQARLYPEHTVIDHWLPVAAAREPVNIECWDGCKIVLAAHKYAACQPQDNKGPYSQVEIAVHDYEGFFAGYMIGPHDVVGQYVPVEVVLSFINTHGGIAGKTKVGALDVT